jgi:hypothetical protein
MREKHSLNSAFWNGVISVAVILLALGCAALLILFSLGRL